MPAAVALALALGLGTGSGRPGLGLWALSIGCDLPRANYLYQVRILRPSPHILILFCPAGPKHSFAVGMPHWSPTLLDTSGIVVFLVSVSLKRPLVLP